MDADRMTALRDLFMSITPEEETTLTQLLEMRKRQAEAAALAAQLPNQGPTFTYLTRQRYCPETGTPHVSLQVILPDKTLSPEYLLEVPIAEGVAQHLLSHASDFRQRYPSDWFEDKSYPIAVEEPDALPENP
jgi:hypothetical protein